MHFDFQYKKSRSTHQQVDVSTLVSDVELADRYNEEISNEFSALTTLLVFCCLAGH